MANDINISVRVSNDTAGGLTAVNSALRELRSRANDSGQALNSLDARALAAAASLRILSGAANDAGDNLRDLRGRTAGASDSMNDFSGRTTASNNSLRTMNTRLGTTDGRLNDLSTRTRTLRTDMDDLDGALTRTGGSLGGLRGTLGGVSGSSNNASGAMEKLKAIGIALSPALIPIASSLAPIIPLAGAAGLAVGAFGAALIPQIGAMSDAAKAQEKYTAAVAKNGPASKEAAQAETAYLDSVGKLPPATREAAASLGVMKDRFKAWSDSLSGDTMPIANKGFAILSGTLSHLSPLVKTSSTELSRMMTILAGGVASNGFDAFMTKVNEFAAKGLRDATTGLLRLGEALSSGKGAGPISEFMLYAKQNGPAVASTMKSLGEALLHLVEAASNVGVGMLTVVNALAKLVSAVPSSAITAIIQLAAAIKLVKLATAGGTAIGAAFTAMSASLAPVRTAAAGAVGPLASLTAAFGALSKGAKLAVAGTGIGLLVIALVELSNVGKKTPPDVDKLNTSLGKLAQTGKASGEAARAYGKDLSTLGDSLRVLARPSNSIGIQQWMTSLIGMDSTPVKKAKEDLDAVDKSLSNMVQGGHADLAAAAFDQIAKAMQKQGMSSAELKGKLDDYKQSLTDQAFEQQLVAQSMGLFGDQAVATKTKLDAQKASADGLRQAIQALNDVNRAALGGQNAFEAAIDAGTKAIQENGKALSMHGGQLDLNSEKARTEEAALRGIASSTDEYAAAVRDSGGSWDQVKGIYDRGHSQIVAQGVAMGLTKAQADQLANTILKMPDKTTFFKGNIADLDAKIKSGQRNVDSLKQKRAVAVGANKTDLDSKVRAAQKALDALKQKKAAAIKASNQTAAGVAAAKRAIASVKDKRVDISLVYTYYTNGAPPAHGPMAGGYAFAHGGIVGAAGGGPRSRQTLVGEHGPEIVDLAPGSRVHSNPDTKRMLAGGTASASSQPIIVQLDLDGKQIAKILIDPLRGEITKLGGNVQKAIGKAGRG